MKFLRETYLWNGRIGMNRTTGCLSPFAFLRVDKGHLFRLQVSKLPCYPKLIPNNEKLVTFMARKNGFQVNQIHSGCLLH